MGDFSRNTFDQLKHYVGVRLQQGVPLIDADWNELEDIRKYEVQAFLKWFVGDGVPEGNDGFRIVPIAGGGENTLVLTSNTPGPGLSALSINLAASTAAAALGFGDDNHTAERAGSSPARLTGDTAEPFSLAGGMTLVFSADGQPEEAVTFQAADFADIGAATAAEVVAAINATAVGLTASEGTGNDFDIQGGDGTAEGAGRCLVDGWDAIIEQRIKYTAQPLYDNADLALAWGVAPLPPLSPPALPTVERTDTVYLDVWEREVTAAEDENLINPLVGLESSTRIKREWVVRVRQASEAPQPGDPDFEAGHSYYALATLTRRNDDDSINLADVRDAREQRLLVPPATLVTDLFGVSATDYRRGAGRPPISLREAINALLRGELPSTPAAPIAPDPGLDVMKRAFLFDNIDGLIAVWYSDRIAATDQVFAARLDTNEVEAGFVEPPHQVTTGAAHNEPHAALLPNGDLIVVYQTGIGAASDVLFKHAQLPQLNSATEEEVAATAGTAETSAFVVVSGDLATFLYHLGGATNRWQFRRYRYTDDSWADPGPIELSPQTTPQRDLHAVRDAAGDVWVAFRVGDNVHALRLRPSTATVAHATTHDSGMGVDDQPFVLAAANGDVWVFWRSPAALHHARFTGGAWEGVQSVPNSAPDDRQPTAVEDADGGIWLFWVRGAFGSGDIYFARRDPATGAWADPRRMTVSPGDDSTPFALMAPNNAIWAFWSSDRDGDVNLYYKRLVTAL